MKRIILHWTGGPYKPTGLDKESYHEIIDDLGRVHQGKFKIEENKAPIGTRKNYAAHTRGCNSDSIGRSMSSMGGAIENKTNGKFPFTEKQFEMMCMRTARDCIKYAIPITDKTVLTHAEVQPNLGIKQKQKWDITVIPFKPELKGAKACGDYMRKRVAFYRNEMLATAAAAKPVPTTTKAPVTTIVTPKKETVWEQIKRFFK